jgi:hypothetical protein
MTQSDGGYMEQLRVATDELASRLQTDENLSQQLRQNPNALGEIDERFNAMSPQAKEDMLRELHRGEPGAEEICWIISCGHCCLTCWSRTNA